MLVTTRIINAMDLRHTCIVNHWYTRGSNEDYSRMLGLCEDAGLTDRLLNTLVADIYNHSDWEGYNLSEEEIAEHIAWILVNKTAITKVEWEEEK